MFSVKQKSTKYIKIGNCGSFIGKKKNKPTETLRVDLIADLLDKDFKALILKMLKELK